MEFFLTMKVLGGIETFVTQGKKRKEVLQRIEKGLDECLYLGNIDAQRDWGHAKDYVEMQWMMLQIEKPEDFVIATGRMETVRRFCELTANKLGWDKGHECGIIWENEGLDEIGRSADTGEIVIKIDPRYYRPTEVQELLGDATKAKEILNWEPKTTLEQLVAKMVDSEIKRNRITMNKNEKIFINWGEWNGWKCNKKSFN